MNPRTILLVDDDADLREMLVEQLSLYEEFVVLEEESATKGIHAARGGGGEGAPCGTVERGPFAQGGNGR